MRAIRRVRLFGILVLVALLVLLATWYFTFTSERERYLISRNARILTTIATQVDSSIAAQERMFRTFLRSGSEASWFNDAKEEVPSLEFVDESRLPQAVSGVDFTPTSRVALEGRSVWLLLSFAAKSRPDLGTREVRLALGRLLAPIFTPQQGDRAFDTLVLATSDGRVLHAIGAQSAELMLTRLDAMRPELSRRFVLGTSRPESTPAPTFKTIGATTGLLDVMISGTAYKLFSQPCCLVTTLQTDAADATSRQSDSSLVIVGLVNASEFRSKTHEISPVLVIACLAVILLSLAGWPFLKIRLLGERQRAKRLDVIAVVACGIFGIALLTIVLLDLYAYSQLGRARDHHLEEFARELSQAVQRELHDAYRQLRCLEAAAPRPATNERLTATNIFDELPAARRRHAGTDGDCLASGAPAYPFFETFSLIDAKGMQRVKWTPGAWLPEPIDVRGRTYFTDVIAGRAALRSGPSLDPAQSVCPDGCVLESIWSWTTTRPEAVLSMPTSDPGFPVAALAIPMVSLIRPIIPEGFEFAVIDDKGLVLFHSNPQRNTYEDLFQETDQSRRLRAVIAGRIAENVDLQYAGRSYRAHVDRLGIGNWSVVTLYGNGPAWALHIEWLVIAMAILVGYTLALTLLLVFCLWTRRSEWLWADPRQVEKYKPLSLYILVLLIVGSVAVLFVRGGLLILLAFMLPLAGWLVSYLTLRRPPPGVMRLRDAHAAYATLAVLLFLLTGVIPAAGFLTAAYDVQARTHVKYSQLKLAEAVRERLDRARREYRRPDDPASGDNVIVRTRTATDLYDMYYRFLFGSTLNDPQVPSEQRSLLGNVESYANGLFTGFLEGYLPYYSESSVQIRELLHDRAPDDAWSWSTAGPILELRLAGLGHPDGNVVVTSSAPRLWQVVVNGEQPAAGAWIVLAGMVLASLTWAIVRFIETHVCLVGVDQPLWSKVRLAGSSGDNLFVICDPPDRPALAQGTHELHLQSIASSATPDQEWVRKLMEIDRLEAGRPVLLADFDERLEDPDLASRKLTWIEELTHDQTRSIVVLSSASPSMLDHTLRIRLRNGAVSEPQLLERWRAVLASFVVVNWRSQTTASGRRSGPQTPSFTGRLDDLLRLLRRAPAAVTRRLAPAAPDGKRIDDKVLAVLRAEEAADTFVRAICASIEDRLTADRRARDRRDPDGRDSGWRGADRRTAERRKADPPRILREQVLDEIAERTATWYRRLWKACTPDEQLVLAEIAHEGFVNYKSRRTVRRLLGRGLIVKDPSFRVMNETFRRFVLSPQCQADVRAIEGAADPSPWDEVRTPFFVALGSAALFFMFTQRELFDATIAALTTLTIAVPVVVRAVGLMVGRRIDGTDPHKV
jgi:hypothetical protein